MMMAGRTTLPSLTLTRTSRCRHRRQRRGRSGGGRHPGYRGEEVCRDQQRQQVHHDHPRVKEGDLLGGSQHSVLLEAPALRVCVSVVMTCLVNVVLGKISHVDQHSLTFYKSLLARKTLVFQMFLQ